MKLQELYAKVEELKAQGKDAVKAEDVTKAEEIKAQIVDVEKEIKAELMFLEDENSRSLAIQVENLFKKGGGLDMKTIENLGTLEPVNKLESNEYYNAVIDDLMGVANKEAKTLIAEVNNHTTTSTPTVMPQTLVGAIWTQVLEQYPLVNAVPITRIPDRIYYDRHIDTVEGDFWVDESQATQSIEFGFDRFELNGHEITKAVDISFKLEVMSRTDFVAFITSQLATKFGRALSYAIYRGTGNLQPEGILTGLTERAPERLVAVQSYTYQTLTQMFASTKSAFLNGAVIYANNRTIWEDLANIVDENNRPVLMMTVANGSVASIFGVPVVESGELADGEVMLVNMAHAYRFNVLEDITVANERDNRGRISSYYLYSVCDGGLFNEQAVTIFHKGSATGAVAPVKAKVKK